MPLITLVAALFLATPRGILLENLTWPEAEKVLTPETVVVSLSAPRRRSTGRI